MFLNRAVHKTYYDTGKGHVSRPFISGPSSRNLTHKRKAEKTFGGRACLEQPGGTHCRRGAYETRKMGFHEIRFRSLMVSYQDELQAKKKKLIFLILYKKNEKIRKME